MVFIILIAYAFLILPLVLFLVAAAAEIRSYKNGPAFFLRMLEIAAGIMSLWVMTRVGRSEVRSWAMVWASLLLGGLSLVSKYASRVALLCVPWGSAIRLSGGTSKAPITIEHADPKALKLQNYPITKLPIPI